MPHLRRIAFILFLAAWFSAARADSPLLSEATGLADAGGKASPALLRDQRTSPLGMADTVSHPAGR